MNISAAGIRLIDSFEGVRLTAYQDVKGVWTIDVGIRVRTFILLLSSPRSRRATCCRSISE
jgi:GH24 family phage-related lysozyme (muramidase)